MGSNVGHVVYQRHSLGFDVDIQHHLLKLQLFFWRLIFNVEDVGGNLRSGLPWPDFWNGGKTRYVEVSIDARKIIS